MQRTIFFFLLAVCSGCTSYQPSFVSSADDVVKPMSYEECATAKICTLTGRLSVIETDGVTMGEMKLLDGHCVTVSLSKREVAYIARNGPLDTSLEGKVYRGQHDPTYILLKINGRRVGYPRCGDFYVYAQ